MFDDIKKRICLADAQDEIAHGLKMKGQRELGRNVNNVSPNCVNL